MNSSTFKTIFTLALSCAAFFSFNFGLYGQQLPFQAGEKATFTVHYKFGVNADIGGVTFALSESGNNYRLTTTASTNSFFDSIYMLRHTYVTDFTKDNLSTISFTRDVKENNYWAKNDYKFYDNGRRIHAKVTKSTRPDRDTMLTCNTQMRDMVSIFYVLRAADYAAIERNGGGKYVVALDCNVIDLGVRVIGREEIKVSGMGKFKTVKLGVKMKTRAIGEVPSNLASAKEDIFIWVTDDECRLPVYFKAPIRLGAIAGRLSSVQGLKYPLSSKL